MATDPDGTVHKTAIYAGTFIGGVTFTGSLTAFGKLQGLLNSKPLNLAIKNPLNISMALASLGAGGMFMTSPDMMTGMAMLGKAVLTCSMSLYFYFLFFKQGYELFVSNECRA